MKTKTQRTTWTAKGPTLWVLIIGPWIVGVITILTWIIKGALS